MTPRVPRPLLFFACATLAWAVGWSGSCYWSAGNSGHHHHDCHDYCASHCNDPLAHDDHHCHCDCDSPAGGELGIEVYAAIVEGEPGRHPFEQVLGIEGLAAPVDVLAEFGALHAWGAEVLRANPDYFALPEWAGLLVPFDVAAGTEGWTLRWIQVQPDGNVVADGTVELVVDWDGRLVRSTNRARLLW